MERDRMGLKWLLAGTDRRAKVIPNRKSMSAGKLSGSRH